MNCPQNYRNLQVQGKAAIVGLTECLATSRGNINIITSRSQEHLLQLFVCVKFEIAKVER